MTLGITLKEIRAAQARIADQLSNTPACIHARCRN